MGSSLAERFELTAREHLQVVFAGRGYDRVPGEALGVEYGPNRYLTMVLRGDDWRGVDVSGFGLRATSFLMRCPERLGVSLEMQPTHYEPTSYAFQVEGDSFSALAEYERRRRQGALLLWGELKEVPVVREAVAAACRRYREVGVSAYVSTTLYSASHVLDRRTAGPFSTGPGTSSHPRGWHW